MAAGSRPELDQRLVETGVGDLALVRHQPVVEPLVALGAVGDQRGDRRPRREVGARAEDRHLLDDEADVAVRRDELGEVGLGLLAEAALVVEELDQRELAVRVAADPGKAVVEDRRGVRGQEALVAFLGRGLLLLFDELDHLHQDVGVGKQIGADLGMQRRLVRVAVRRGLGVLRRGREGNGEGEGSHQAEEELSHGILQVNARFVMFIRFCARRHPGDLSGTWRPAEACQRRAGRGISGARVISSVGRASRLHRECRRFEPVITHHRPTPATVAGRRSGPC